MVLLTLALSFLILQQAFVEAQDDLGLSNGYTTFDVGTLKGQIVKDSQTLASLNSTGNEFDFLPSDRLAQLAFNGAHHLGDITLRYRKSMTWWSYDAVGVRVFDDEV